MYNPEKAAKIPVDYMKESTIEYIEYGIMSGNFLRALFENKLVQAFSSADTNTQKYMQEWATYLFNYAPAAWWGSVEKVQKWVEHKGLTGLGG